MKQKTQSPGDIDRVVHRVVAWLLKDDGRYEYFEELQVPNCEYEGCLTRVISEETKFLSTTALALYEELCLTAKNAEEDLSTPETEDTYEFALVSLTKDFTSEQKKHIYFDALNDDIELRFLPPTQKLAITAASNSACHELDMTAITPSIIGTKVHVLTVGSMTCTIYSTQPIKICTLDFTLPEEVKDAPRGDRKVLIQYLREHCNDYLDFAPDALKHKMLLGLVKPKELQCEMKILGVEEVEDEEEEESEE